MKAIDLTGKRFTRLTVIRPAEDRGGRRCWHCTCDCGAFRLVVTEHLRSGHTKSCGCYSAEILGNRRRTHGMSGSPEYNVWMGIIQRCCNKNYRECHLYGGRGIQICSQWKQSFSAFFSDMGPRPSLTHSIDRINNNGNYTPENCRWATVTMQANNKRTSRSIRCFGETKTIAEWARVVDIGYATLRNRVGAGWPIEQALTMQPKIGRNQTFNH